METREIIYALVGLLVAYLCWLLIRFISVRRKARHKIEPPVFTAALDAETIHSEIVGGEALRTSSSVSFDSSEALESARLPRVRKPVEPDAAEFGFDALLEVRQMHTVVAELRARLDKQELEIGSFKEALAELRAASQVSPLYGEAVALARRGYDTEAIAERCGISVAEAEMVRSLSSEPDKGAIDNGRSGGR